MIKLYRCIIKVVFILLFPVLLFASGFSGEPHFYKPDNPNIQYVGRIDFSNPLQPKFWMPGVYIKVHFTGENCKLFFKDQLLNNHPHNYVEIVIDDERPFQVKITGELDTIDISSRLKKGKHTLLICKNTESGLGYLSFLGISCEKLLRPSPLLRRKIEFIGNSITCGFGNDESTPCSTGQWYDHENAYMGYGPVTARALKAQWHISAVSGIGMIHSCCDMKIRMHGVFDKMNMRRDTGTWNFKNYIPDVVTICLGQNDGIQDSVKFCDAYVGFIKTLRHHYPKAKIVCLNSPMANKKLDKVLQNYIDGIVSNRNRAGDQRVYKFFFNNEKVFIKGCDGHPNGKSDQKIAAALTQYIRSITDW